MDWNGMRGRLARWLIAALIAAATPVVGCGGSSDDGATATQAKPPRVDPAKQARMLAIGKRVFAEHCHSCHGLLGKPRTTPVIEFEAPRFDDVKPTPAYVRRRIREGGIGMQSFEGELTAREVEGIVTYVATVSGRNVDDDSADATDADTLATGESLFQQNCARCHGIAGSAMKGRPGYPGTDFNFVKPGQRFVIRSMHVGLEGAMPSFTKALDRSQMRAIAAYVTSIAAEED